MENKTMNLTAEQRTKALLYYFGWQGGTVHQLADETGLTTDQILYDRPNVPEGILSEYGAGFCTVRTCTCDWRVKTMAPRKKGILDFWLGVMDGYFITGELPPERKVV